MTEVCVIILAAGRGSRLGSITKRMPKCLVPVQGREILHRQLSAFIKNDIKQVVLVVGYKEKMVRSFVAKYFPYLPVTYVVNKKRKSNTLYSLALAASKVRPSKCVFVLNGDVIFDEEIVRLMAAVGSKKNLVAIRPGKCGAEEVKAVLGKDESVVLLNKNVDPRRAAGEAIGINKFSASSFKILVANLAKLKNDFLNAYFEYAVEKTIAQGQKFFPYDIGVRRALEIDFPKDLKKANKTWRHDSR